MTDDSDKMVADLNANNTDLRFEDKFWSVTNLEAGSSKHKFKIRFPHLESKVTSPSGDHLAKHITHCIEDNAKLHAEFSYPWGQSRKDKASLHELSKFYNDMTFWVIVADYFHIEISNPQHVQELLDKAWHEIEIHPHLMKNQCDDCEAIKVKV